jgi:hypothetical protein
MERVGRSDRAADGSRSGQDRMLLAAQCRAARAALVQPCAVVVENGKAETVVRSWS